MSGNTPRKSHKVRINYYHRLNHVVHMCTGGRVKQPIFVKTRETNYKNKQQLRNQVAWKQKVNKKLILKNRLFHPDPAAIFEAAIEVPSEEVCGTDDVCLFFRKKLGIDTMALRYTVFYKNPVFTRKDMAHMSFFIVCLSMVDSGGCFWVVVCYLFSFLKFLSLIRGVDQFNIYRTRFFIFQSSGLYEISCRNFPTFLRSDLTLAFIRSFIDLEESCIVVVCKWNLRLKEASLWVPKSLLLVQPCSSRYHLFSIPYYMKLTPGGN